MSGASEVPAIPEDVRYLAVKIVSEMPSRPPFKFDVENAIMEAIMADRLARPVDTGREMALAEVLKPFAAIADIFDHRSNLRPDADNDPLMQWADHRVGEATLTLGDLRRAREAYRAIANPEEGRG